MFLNGKTDFQIDNQVGIANYRKRYLHYFQCAENNMFEVATQGPIERRSFRRGVASRHEYRVTIHSRVFTGSDCLIARSALTFESAKLD